MGRAGHLMTSTLTIAAPTSAAATGWGALTYGAQTTQLAYVEDKVESVFTPDGRSIQTSHKIITETAIDRSARVWPPGADTSDTNAAKTIVAEGRVGSPRDGYSLYDYRIA